LPAAGRLRVILAKTRHGGQAQREWCGGAVFIPPWMIFLFYADLRRKNTLI